MDIGKKKNEIDSAETQAEVMSDAEVLAMDIIAETPFDELQLIDKDDPEIELLLGLPTMAPFEVLIEEAREKSKNLNHFFAIVDVIFREYESRCIARFKIMFKDPEPFNGWIRERVKKRRNEFYQKETPSQSDREYEEVCKIMIGGVPDFTTMVDVDVDLDGMPMQEEIEEFTRIMSDLSEEDRDLYRAVVKANRPEFWAALENFSDTDVALFTVRTEAWDERDLGDKFEYLVKERISDLQWQELANQTDHLKQQLKDLGIDLDEEDE